jgi:DNA-binding transcriptional ArsR family regulator
MAKQQDSGDIAHRWHRALDHPLRADILRILSEEPTSPNALSSVLGESLGNVAYHTRVLLEYDCIELVCARPVGGTVEHVYKAKPPPF